MSFTDAPVTKALVLSLAGLSIAASIFDIKHYFYISIGTHFFRYGQLWRIFTYQLCYTNSSEVLFGAMSLYHMRMVERFWGSRKYAVSAIASLQLSHCHANRKIVIHPYSRPHNRHPPTFLPFRLPPPPFLRSPWLHPRRSHPDPLRHSSAVPRHDPANLQVQGLFIHQCPSIIIIQRRRQRRRHERSHLLGQVDSVSHGLAAGPLPVAWISPWGGDRLGGRVSVAQRPLADGGVEVEGPWMGGWYAQSEEEW